MSRITGPDIMICERWVWFWRYGMKGVEALLMEALLYDTLDICSMKDELISIIERFILTLFTVANTRDACCVILCEEKNQLVFVCY